MWQWFGCDGRRPCIVWYSDIRMRQKKNLQKCLGKFKAGLLIGDQNFTESDITLCSLKSVVKLVMSVKKL